MQLVQTSRSGCRRVRKFLIAIDLVAELCSHGSRTWVQLIPSIPASHEGPARVDAENEVCTVEEVVGLVET